MLLQDMTAWAEKLQTSADLAKLSYNNLITQLPKTIKKIAFVGMGGSGIAGKIIQELVADNCQLPIFTIDSPQIPAHFDKETLTFAISYSGNTWETLDAIQELTRRSIPTIILSNGGEAYTFAKKHNIPFITIAKAVTPRSSLGSILGFLLQFFDLLGIYNGAPLITQYVLHAEKYIPLYLEKSFFSEFLALAKPYNFFHLWGIRGDSSACTYRAQTQFNENSKIPTVCSTFPELSHNLLVGFSEPINNPLVVLIHSNFLSISIKKAIDDVCTIIKQRGTLLYKPTLFGDNLQVQLFDMILWADFASYHLGMARGVNVSAVEIIDLLKKMHKQKILG